MALIEATAAGVPIVCSDIPGNRDVVKDGINGFLVNGEAGMYARKVEEIINDGMLAAKLSSNGKKIARDMFGEAIVIDKTYALYRELLRQKDCRNLA